MYIYIYIFFFFIYIQLRGRPPMAAQMYAKALSTHKYFRNFGQILVPRAYFLSLWAPPWPLWVIFVKVLMPLRLYTDF